MLETFGLDVGNACRNFPPVRGNHLAKHVHGEPATENFNDISVIGMLLYLAGYTCPETT